MIDDEQGRKWHMAITDVKRNGFTMEWSKVAEIGVVDEHEFAILLLVEHLAQERRINSHRGKTV